MKKSVFIFFTFLFFIACDNIPHSPLIGKWQLKTVEKNGEKTLVDTVWYNFQSESVFMLQVYRPQQDRVVAFFGLRTQDEDVISIKLESEAPVGYSDWEGATRSFTIDKVNNKKLMLRSEEGYRYSFIKF
ncbi:MAG: lipocalin-like domain-containing protein [Tannerella sp.]|jgi:hypothetical protein|nr:lipocalin-like domain-containing protein [Tannerella sp.]